MAETNPEALTATEPSVSRRPVGRPSYEAEDAPLCAALIQMWKAGEARSIEAAARSMWTVAAGYGSSDAKVDRIAKRARALRDCVSE